jgi:hypothetical protein
MEHDDQGTVCDVCLQHRSGPLAEGRDFVEDLQMIRFEFSNDRDRVSEVRLDQ